MEVDIGYMQTMELRSTGPSLPVSDAGGEGIQNVSVPVPSFEFELDSIEWAKEISIIEARQRLEVAMYPFKKVITLLFG